MIGDRLGNWTILQELGRGGMGRVFLAVEQHSGRQAALKVLSGELAQEEGFLLRFQREILTLSELNHPNIVRFFESGCDNNRYYYAMEYVAGKSLEAILETQGRIPYAEVLDIAIQVCPALRHVHDHGIIHRDIKPSNLLRADDGTIKLTDFGIVKVFAGTHLTASGGIIGTAEFLSPEQAAGKIVGKRSDIYSLGIVLYNLLVGKPPFVGTGYVDLLHKHRYAQFDRPGKVIPEIPYEIDELVCQMLEKDPEKRPRDCFVLGKQLTTIQRRLERKTNQTNADNSEAQTRAENLAPPKILDPRRLMHEALPGDVDADGRSLVQRVFNHPAVLAILLGLCLGVIGWAFWPMSEKQLYSHGAELMASDRLSDLETAWREYLEPLNSRYPNHPYHEQIEKFKQKLDLARAPHPSEAQRFFVQGEQLRKSGDFPAAQKVWRDLIEVFRASDAESMWVRRAENALTDLDTMLQSKDRWLTVRPALDRATQWQHEGKTQEARRLLAALESLYQHDSGAGPILEEIHRLQQQMTNAPP